MAPKGALKDLPATGKRWSAVILNKLEYSEADIKEATGMNNADQRKWVERYELTGDVLHSEGQGKRTDREESMQETRTKLKEICKGGTMDARSSKAMSRHVPVGPRQVRRVLIGGDISSGYAPLRVVPRLTERSLETRFKFCRSNRRTGFTKWAFTDSKYFYGTITAEGAKKVFMWHHPDFRWEVGVDKHAQFKVHVYGGVTAYGAPPLVYATGGTRRLESTCIRLTGKNRGTLHAGVCDREYVNILDELCPRLSAIFAEHGIDDWTFQQDGASAHKTDRVKRHLEQLMGRRFCWNWPANSPDLSWIENIWSIVERRLWEVEQWHDLGSFETAVCRAWQSVTNDLELMHSMAVKTHDRMEKCYEAQGGALDY